MEPDRKPEFADGDDDDPPEFDIDFVPDEAPQYFWTKDVDEIRRTFIFDKLADPSIDGRILVENMELIFKWLTKGDLPKAKKSHLKVADPS